MIKSDERIEIVQIDDGFILTRTFLQEVMEQGKRLYDQEVELFGRWPDETENQVLARLLRRVAEWLGVKEDAYGIGNINISFNRKGRKTE